MKSLRGMGDMNVKNFKNLFTDQMNADRKYKLQVCSKCFEYELVCEQEFLAFSGTCIRCTKEYTISLDLQSHVYQFSRENNMQPGLAHPALQALNLAESSLLALLNSCKNCFTFSWWRCLKGQFC